MKTSLITTFLSIVLMVMFDRYLVTNFGITGGHPVTSWALMTDISEITVLSLTTICILGIYNTVGFRTKGFAVAYLGVLVGSVVNVLIDETLFYFLDYKNYPLIASHRESLIEASLIGNAILFLIVYFVVWLSINCMCRLSRNFRGT